MIVYFEIQRVKNAIKYLKVFYYVKNDETINFTDIIFQFYDWHFKDFLLNKNATTY